MTLDLQAYAARIQYRGDFRADLDLLRVLHLQHATHIPFENVDVLLGRPIALDLDSLQRKLIEERRGGYCFEQNTLFAAVLEECGFRVRRLGARVRLGASGVRARTHMVLAVEAEGQSWLCDVGFGGDGLLWPVPLRLGETASQFAWEYRLVQENGACVLQSARPAGWLDLYSFTMEEQYPIDYAVANYYTSTHPNSIFRRILMVQRPGPKQRLTMLNRKLIERTAVGEKEETLPDEGAVLETLEERFGLRLPPETHLPSEELAGAI